MDSNKSENVNGTWKRASSAFRNWIVPVDKATRTDKYPFPAQPDRYHLYAAWNCPWAHRCLLTRKLKHLEDIIAVSYTAPRRDERGWVFDPDTGFTDQLYGEEALTDIYLRDDPGYTGRITVPLLWDAKLKRIVSNESADIIQMFNHAFGELAAPSPDLYPEDLHSLIDTWNDDIYQNLNNGVYRAGFAESQQAYNLAVNDVFDCLDRIDTHLQTARFLAGSVLTLADVRLFPTLARFDVAYYGAFKCNLRRLIDFPNLWNYARDLYQIPGIAETVKFDIYKQGYFSPSEKRNPFGIVPIGPNINWTVPHDRTALN